SCVRSLASLGTIGRIIVKIQDKKREWCVRGFLCARLARVIAKKLRQKTGNWPSMSEVKQAKRSTPSVVVRVKGRSPAHLALDIMVLEIIKTAELRIGHWSRGFGGFSRFQVGRCYILVVCADSYCGRS